MKKIIVFMVVFVMVCSVSAFASTNKPLERLGSGLNNIAYGEIEIPDSIDETGTKGTPAFPNCTDKTNDDVGRGIARFVGGVWQIATFWYPEESS